MPRYEFKKVARAALLDQLIAAGFPPTTPVEMDATRCWVTVAPESFNAVATVVAAHDAAAIDLLAQQARTARQQARAVIVGYPDLTAPTNAQTAAAIKALCKAVAVLFRED